MRAVLVEPDKMAKIVDIDPSIENLQRIVGGYVEAYQPWPERVTILCNEDGKEMGLEINRTLVDEDGNIIDVLVGTFLIVGEKGTNFADLTEEQAKHFKLVFDPFTVRLERS